MRKNRIWIIAGTVVVIAVIVMFTTVNRSDITVNVALQGKYSAAGDRIEINKDGIGKKASYYNAKIDGKTVEVFAVRASDGTVRLAMNTCQVCNGSPYAYFEQDGDYFVCQNCRNRFSSNKIGLASGGCNPVPITADDYAEVNGIITVFESFLKENAYRFSNWKQFEKGVL